MEVKALTNVYKEKFIAYCKKYRNDVDDSFLYDEDLRNFELNDDNPTYLILNQEREIIAAASLMIDEYNKRGKKARFRLFHSEVDDFSCYSLLLEKILLHTKGLEKVFLFINLENEKLMNIMKKLNFTIERYSFVLLRENTEVEEPVYSTDYNVRDFRQGKDEEVWCNVRNEGFAKLQGNETPIDPENVAKMLSSEDYLEGGMKILYHQEKPVGVVRCTNDVYLNEPTMNIGPISIIPDYQGKGLGRNLLRTALKFAQEQTYKKTILCVNAENDHAKKLYLQEGFKQVEAVACYKYDLTV
ncbi:GNAT family N-acetyltransferase [Metabacillus litoralis]|nr:GNAT family N-acetyltransferase [Metabacillus litoralis]